MWLAVGSRPLVQAALRFSAVLDGLAVLRLRQMHQPSRKRLTELAIAGTRAELARAPAR